MGGELREENLEGLMKFKLKQSRGQLQKITLALKRMSGSNEQSEKIIDMQSSKTRMKLFHSLQNLFYKQHPKVEQDFMTLQRHPGIVSILKVNGPATDAKRVTGKNDQFELFSELILMGHEKRDYSKDLGITLLKKIPYQDQGVVVCCKCGCTNKYYNCCDEKTQND